MKTHYENLQVTENASLEVIKGAYKFLSQKWHPDKNPDNRAESERITRILNEAYTVLSDPIRRKEHDDWIHKERQKTTANQERAAVQQHADLNSVSTEHQPTPQGFLKRAWLMLVFTASLVLLLGAVPYAIYTGKADSKWGQLLLGVFFWLGIGWSSYERLFHPEIVAEEEQKRRQEIEKRPAIKPSILKGLLAGAAAGAAGFVFFAVTSDSKMQFSFDLVTFGFFVIAGSIVGAFILKR